MNMFFLKTMFIGAVAFGGTVSAALPPIYQSIREIEAILESKELPEAMGSPYPITRIERNEAGYSVVNSRGKVVEVEVIYAPKQMAGPARFSLMFNPKS